MILSAPHNADNDTADAALETRFYPLQNWRADVVCVGKLSGGGFQLVEVIDYDTYGNAVSRPAISADFNRDGGVDGSDQDDFFAAFFAGEPSADIDLNGGIEGGDLGVWFDVFESGVMGPSPGACVDSGVIAGYAGYVRDRWAPDLYHVRHRVYDTKMGTWTRRDPLGYVDGMGLYEYCIGDPISRRDFSGLDAGWGKRKYADPYGEKEPPKKSGYQIAYSCSMYNPIVGIRYEDSGVEWGSEHVYVIHSKLKALKARGCCIRYLSIDAHCDSNKVYSTKGDNAGGPSDAVSVVDLVADMPPLCKGATVCLEVCKGTRLRSRLLRLTRAPKITLSRQLMEKNGTHVESISQACVTICNSKHPNGLREFRCLKIGSLR